MECIEGQIDAVALSVYYPIQVKHIFFTRSKLWTGNLFTLSNHSVVWKNVSFPSYAAHSIDFLIIVYSDHAKIIVINRKWAVIWSIDNTTETEQVNRKFVIIIRTYNYCLNKYFWFLLSLKNTQVVQAEIRHFFLQTERLKSAS